MSKTRSYCLTINNWTDEQLQSFEDEAEQAAYAVCGKEVGASGTRHLQCYIRFKNQRSFMAVKKLFPTAHIEVAKGDDKDNEEYCTKDDTDARIWGTPKKPGTRNDLKRVRDVLKETGKMADVVEVATSYQSVRMAECILKYNEPTRAYGRRNVYWYYGATGTGKTFTIYEKHPDVFTPQSFKWWEGYDHHKVVLLDDIRGDYCKFHEMLMLTGERPFRVECKGGSRQAAYDDIYITSPYHPKDLWHTVEDKSQLLDRITEIRHFTGDSKRQKNWLRGSGSEVGGNTNPDPIFDMFLN